MGRAAVHRDRVPRGLLHQLPPLPAGLPRHGARPGRPRGRPGGPGARVATRRSHDDNPPHSAAPLGAPAGSTPPRPGVPPTGLLVCAPMWIEAQALRRVLPAGTVHRSGYGVRSRARAARVAADGAGVVAVAGLGGATRRTCAPATSSSPPRSSDGTATGPRRVPCPTAPLLAARWPTPGPAPSTSVRSTRRDRHRDPRGQRPALAAPGRIAVDMESAWVVGKPPPGRPVGAVAGRRRVVVDTAAELRSPCRSGAVRDACRRLAAVADGARRRGRRHRRPPVVLSPRHGRSAPASSGRSRSSSSPSTGSPARSTSAARSSTTPTSCAGCTTRGAVFVDEVDEVPRAAPSCCPPTGSPRTSMTRRRARAARSSTPPAPRRQGPQRGTSVRPAGRHVVLIGHADHEETQGTLGEVAGGACSSGRSRSADQWTSPTRTRSPT